RFRPPGPQRRPSSMRRRQASTSAPASLAACYSSRLPPSCEYFAARKKFRTANRLEDHKVLVKMESGQALRFLSLYWDRPAPARISSVQAGRDRGQKAALEAGAVELLLAGPARAVREGGGGHAVGRAAAHHIHAHLVLVGIAEWHDDDAVVLERGLGREDRVLGAAVLGRGRGHDGGDLAVQRAGGEQRAGLVEEVLELAR